MHAKKRVMNITPIITHNMVVRNVHCDPSNKKNYEEFTKQ